MLLFFPYFFIYYLRSKCKVWLCNFHYTCSAVSSSGLSSTREMGLEKRVQQSDMEVVDSTIPPVRKRWESWDFSSWRREGWGNFINVCKHWREGTKTGEARLFSAKSSDSTEAETQEVPSEERKYFLTVKMVEHWHGLPREADKPPSLDIFKNCLDVVLGRGLCVVLLWAPHDLQRHLPICHSVILNLALSIFHFFSCLQIVNKYT